MQLGVNAEHSWADAPIVGYLMEYASNLENEIRYSPDGHTLGYDNLVKSLPCPSRLQWALPPECVACIESAKAEAELQIADLDMYVLIHTAFGKGAIKKCKLSPDAFIQMALQMAYYKVCRSCSSVLADSYNSPTTQLQRWIGKEEIWHPHQS